MCKQIDILIKRNAIVLNLCYIDLLFFKSSVVEMRLVVTTMTRTIRNCCKIYFSIYVFLSSLRYIKMNKWHVYNNTRFFAVVPLLLHSQSFTIRENTYMRWWWFFYPSITLSISFMCQVFIRFKCSSMAYDYIFPFFFATSAS